LAAAGAGMQKISNHSSGLGMDDDFSRFAGILGGDRSQ
jgi:hypothetical protein